MTKVRAVIFDVGNVLVRWDPRNLYRQHFSNPDELEFFLREIATPAWNLEQDRGRPFAEAVALLTKDHPEYAPLIELYDSQWVDTLGGPIEEVVALLQALHDRGAPLFAITNFSAEKWPVFRQKYAFTSRFRDVVVSGQEGVVKPDRRIYEMALSRFGLNASEAFFIDDSLANVEGARAVGINSHHFTGADKLEADLRQLGLLP